MRPPVLADISFPRYSSLTSSPGPITARQLRADLTGLMQVTRLGSKWRLWLSDNNTASYASSSRPYIGWGLLESYPIGYRWYPRARCPKKNIIRSLVSSKPADYLVGTIIFTGPTKIMRLLNWGLVLILYTWPFPWILSSGQDCVFVFL